MSSEVRPIGTARHLPAPAAGVVSGVIAGVGMGLVLSVGTELVPLIGALYGRESFLWGWVAHLLNSAAFGLLFSLVVSRPVVRPDPPRVGTYLAYGLVYGALLEIVTGGVLFPLWLRAGAAPELALPFFPIPGTADQFVPAVLLGVGHLVYGALLGPAYALTSGAIPLRGGP